MLALMIYYLICVRCHGCRVLYIQSLLNGLFIMCSEMSYESDSAEKVDMLLKTQPYIDEMSNYSRRSDLAGNNGPTLWQYEYMFYNRFAEHYQLRGDSIKELKQRTRAVSVWWDMYHAGEHGKYGPNPHDLLADPHKNVAIMLDRYASMICAGGEGNVEDALRALERCLAFHDEVWTPREYHPPEVLKDQIKRLLSQAQCLQLKYDTFKLHSVPDAASVAAVTSPPSSLGNPRSYLLSAKEGLERALVLAHDLVDCQVLEKAVRGSLEAVEGKLKIADNSHKKSGRFWRKGTGAKKKPSADSS